MPYDIIRNGPGCKGGYAVVGPSGAHGCHRSRKSAIQQQRALYAAESSSKKVTKAEDWEGKPLYDELSDAEQMLADALLKLATEAGPLDKAEGIWIGYENAEDNENAEIGVKCGNCALHKSSVACAILEMPIEEEGACRFAVIPDGYVTAGSDVREDMEDNNDMNFENDMSKRSLEDLDLRPTESMASNARRGLELRRKFGRGGTAVGVARARDLANRKELSPGTVLRMYSFFSRHEVDKQGKDWNNSERPSNGKIAWLLWGGDSGYAWAKSKRNAIMNIRSQKSDGVWIDSPFNLQKYIDKTDFEL